MFNNQITHVFVLQLENRSFDSMLGFSGITGTDAVTGLATAINGLAGTESNTYDGTTYTVQQPSYQTMPVDPGHEFQDVLYQLGGQAVQFTAGGPYPTGLDNSGFVYDYVNSPSAEEGQAPNNFGAIMCGYSPSQLPILNALAQNFAVCDSWFSALPGPTWPNRFFVHAASSDGLDASPSNSQMAGWQASGVTFPNGTILNMLDEALEPNCLSWRLFSDSPPPMTITTALSGVSLSNVSSIADFCARIQYPAYVWPYTFLEPNYGDVIDASYTGGSSQHPIDSVTAGEALIKQVYEAIRQSPYWENCLLIVTYDEHGGFYDHVTPPSAVPPGDTQPLQALNVNGFGFDQYGVRVPAVIVSPFIPAGIIDHRIYDHASIPKMLENMIGLPSLTARDAQANDPSALATLTAARTDAPMTLPAPNWFSNPTASAPHKVDRNAPIPASQRAFLTLAMTADVEMSPPGSEAAIKAHVASLRTVGEAGDYLAGVLAKHNAAKAASAAHAQAMSSAKKTAEVARKRPLRPKPPVPA
jgi:phospholipase C